jgi:glyoxylase-like metal-dependent hydrolase (beta-lactamase superfamily II)
MWTEVGDRAWVRRYPEWDVNVGVVAGSDGLLVIDTRGTLRQGEQLRDDVRRLSPAPVRWVVNTHLHFDHTFGNAAFGESEIHAHENAVALMLERGEWIKGLYAESDDPMAEDVIASPLVPAQHTFAGARVLDLGDRRVELLHIGNGHTDGDAVAVVPDTDVVFVGDMIEESAPPAYGNDCFPLDWPETVERLIGLLRDETRVVPGHGAVVDPGFVREQGAEIAAVANTISGLHHSGASVDEALAYRDWPYPAERMQDAVRRGYEQLGPPRKPLPLA